MILVTGANGFLGKNLVDLLKKQCRDFIAPSSEELDLLDHKKVYKYLTTNSKISHIIHLAAYQGNIQFNIDYPADIYFSNTLMNANLLGAAQLAEVNNIICVVPSCSYPDLPILKEEDYWKGKPHETIASHGLSRRYTVAAAEFYNKQYGMNILNLCMNNLYGPYDSLDLSKTKVCGGLILKFLKAMELSVNDDVTIWGTGNVKRELLFAPDAALSIMKVFDANIPKDTILMNIGNEQEFSINDLAQKIGSILNFNGKIQHDTSKPDGQNSKKLISHNMRNILQWSPPTSIEEGLKKTIEWYQDAINIKNTKLITYEKI